MHLGHGFPIAGQPEPAPWYEPFMIAICATMLLSALQQKPSDPFESRRPESRERLLERGGGSQETEAAVRKALEWLAKNQKPDHSWEAPEEDYTVGVTALALLAFLGAGHGPKSESFGEPVRRGMKYLLSAQDREGCIGSRGEKYMYGHILATFALAEAHGMSSPETYGKAAQRAVDFLVSARNKEKAWRYAHQGGDNDTSVTTWAVMALRAAERTELAFPKSVYEGALAWYDEVTDQTGRAGYLHRGPIHVQIPGVDADFEWHTTTTAMELYGRWLMIRRRPKERLEAAIPLLTRDPPKTEKNAVDFCYWHFASLAIFSLKGPDSAEWKAWNEALKSALLKTQEAAGSWEPNDRWSTHVKSRVYATAINTKGQIAGSLGPWLDAQGEELDFLGGFCSIKT